MQNCWLSHWKSLDIFSHWKKYQAKIVVHMHSGQLWDNLKLDLSKQIKHETIYCSCRVATAIVSVGINYRKAKHLFRKMDSMWKYWCEGNVKEDVYKGLLWTNPMIPSIENRKKCHIMIRNQVASLPKSIKMVEHMPLFWRKYSKKTISSSKFITSLWNL